MVACTHACVLLAICLICVQITLPYNIRNHPCCLEPNENLTLAMIIDAFEIYGHDPTDKLDNLWLYQNEMLRIKTADDQYMINERIHIATDHLGRFVKLHIQELKVLLITLDDVLDNMLTMYDNHNAMAAERKATYAGGPVPVEFYLSQEFYCGKNVYIFISELYSDIYNMGRGVAPYCKDRSFVFLGFLHFHDEHKYYLLDDPSISFPTDNYLHGLECHIGICIFRFPFKKLLQRVRDVITLPKAIVKCGTEMYKLPPLTAASCIITSGSFILDFNIQGIRYRHYDYLLESVHMFTHSREQQGTNHYLKFDKPQILAKEHRFLPRMLLEAIEIKKHPNFNREDGWNVPPAWDPTMPNGNTYYTKEPHSPLICDHHVCEWNYTNHYGGPFLIPGDPGTGIDVVPPYIEPTPKPEEGEEENITMPYILDGCLFMYPPNYGSIAGKSYLDNIDRHDDRFTCNAAGGNKQGLYWYPQWMGTVPHHPYPTMNDEKEAFESQGNFYPHQPGYEYEEPDNE